MLLQNPALADYAENRSSPRPLHLMVTHGKLEHVKAFIDAGASLNQRNILGLRPIDTAARNGSYDIVILLVESGADFHRIHDIKNGSLLRLALEEGQSSLAILLLGKGASFDEIIDEEGNTVLHYAIKKGHQELINACFKNLEDKFRSTSAFTWSRLSSSESPPHGLTVKNRKGETPLSLAAEAGDIETIKKLHNKGVRFTPRPAKN